MTGPVRIGSRGSHRFPEPPEIPEPVPRFPHRKVGTGTDRRSLAPGVEQSDGLLSEGGITVGHDTGGEVKRDRHVSQLMVDILTAASRAEAGTSVRDLVAAAQRTGRSRLVAQASVSRALRRLWRQGVAELHDRRWAGTGRTLSGQRRRAREIAAEARANPEAFYRDALRFRTGISKRDLDPWGSADACVLAKAREAEKMPTLRVVRVTVTDAGRALLRLTRPLAGQLTGLRMLATESEAAE